MGESDKYIGTYWAILSRVLSGTDEEVDEFFEKVVFGDDWAVTIDVATRNLVYAPLSAFEAD